MHSKYLFSLIFNWTMPTMHSKYLFLLIFNSTMPTMHTKMCPGRWSSVGGRAITHHHISICFFSIVNSTILIIHTVSVSFFFLSYIPCLCPFFFWNMFFLNCKLNHPYYTYRVCVLFFFWRWASVGGRARVSPRCCWPCIAWPWFRLAGCMYICVYV